MDEIKQPTEAELEARRAANEAASKAALDQAEAQMRRDAQSGALNGIAGALPTVADAIKRKLESGDIQEGSIHVLVPPS